jgi:hypothetical protein
MSEGQTPARVHPSFIANQSPPKEKGVYHEQYRYLLPSVKWVSPLGCKLQPTEAPL